MYTEWIACHALNAWHTMHCSEDSESSESRSACRLLMRRVPLVEGPCEGHVMQRAVLEVVH